MEIQNINNTDKNLTLTTEQQRRFQQLERKFNQKGYKVSPRILQRWAKEHSSEDLRQSSPTNFKRRNALRGRPNHSSHSNQPEPSIELLWLRPDNANWFLGLRVESGDKAEEKPAQISAKRTAYRLRRFQAAHLLKNPPPVAPTRKMRLRSMLKANQKPA